MTKDESRYLAELVSTGCALCRYLGTPGTPAEIHHIRTGMGTGRRASHYETIPLCYEHHRGGTGIHGLGRKAFERFHGITELELMDFSRKSLKHYLISSGIVLSYACETDLLANNG